MDGTFEIEGIKYTFKTDKLNGELVLTRTRALSTTGFDDGRVVTSWTREKITLPETAAEAIEDFYNLSWEYARAVELDSIKNRKYQGLTTYSISIICGWANKEFKGIQEEIKKSPYDKGEMMYNTPQRRAREIKDLLRELMSTSDDVAALVELSCPEEAYIGGATC